MGTYTATTSTANLADGTYKGSIRITSSVAAISDVTISVEAQVGNPNLTGNAGVQYILIYDKDAQEGADGVIQASYGSIPLIAEKGQYSYQVTGIEKGSYYVVTGSDLDLDNKICDAGESCGQYPTLNNRQEIEITEAVPETSADMVVNYLDTGAGASAVNNERQVFSKIIKTSGEFKTAPLKQVAQ